MMPDEETNVQADPNRVKQVLHNLIINASKYGPTESEIVLRVRKMERNVYIEVQDQADTISAEEKTHLFVPYYRGKRAQEEQLPGLGLGLFICKELVEMQNGKIWLESAQNGGNVFGFSLPREGGKQN